MSIRFKANLNSDAGGLHFFILLFETGTKGAYFGFIFIVIPSLRPLWQSTAGELGRDSVPHDPAFHLRHQLVAD
jgi:hypothetical protein